MRTIDELANRLFLTDIVETPVYKEISTELEQKYQRDSDGELPSAYWEELSDLLHAIFTKCGDLSLSS